MRLPAPLGQWPPGHASPRGGSLTLQGYLACPPPPSWHRLLLLLLLLPGAPAEFAPGGGHAPPVDTLRSRERIPLTASDGVVRIELTASARSLELVPGRSTPVFAYNGSIPGPTIDVREGDRVQVRFRNDLPVETTVHWHGLHLPFESDGSPFHPVPPGATRVYEFTPRPGSAGTYWYHPHPHHQTGIQVARGLYGALIVRAPDDPLPPMTERVLVLSDQRLREDGELDLPEPHSNAGIADRENGREGDLILVNGRIRPELTIRPGEVQRWRIINASAGRFYRLTLPGHILVQVGSDGGLFERPVEIDELLLVTGERVELLVRGADVEGTRAVLQSLPYDRYIPQTRPSDWESTREILTLHTTGSRVPTPAIPARLRHVPPIDTAAVSATRLIVFSQGMINGRTMDMERVDISTALGATEIWEVENIVGMDHPFHLHGFQFQVLERNGVPEPFRSWKDTVNVPRHGSVRLVVRYEEHRGRWMFHCHILDHEDHGMMGVLEVH
jgi:FtsP/CotA-like multicopper oxidase with cupredoxin domain